MIYALPEILSSGNQDIKQKNVCLVHQDIWQNPNTKNFIEKVLTAAKLEANNNIAIIEIGDEYYTPIRKFPESVENIILFGISSNHIGLTSLDQLHHVYQFQSRHILLTDHPDVYQDINAKRDLWQALLSMKF